MPATAERVSMGKARGRPKTSDRDDKTVRIARPLASKVKALSDHEGIPVAQILSEILEEPLNARYLKMLKELGAKGHKR
jgi:fructose-1,6-bisphosphatase/sedoheptulose 1,7-bisphosphatase-like protein